MIYLSIYSCLPPRLVAVASSGMEAGGEGVFALTRLPAATLAAVFNGYRLVGALFVIVKSSRTFA